MGDISVIRLLNDKNVIFIVYERSKGAVNFANTLGGSPTIMESVRDEDGEGRSWGRVYRLEYVNTGGVDQQEYCEVPQDYN